MWAFAQQIPTDNLHKGQYEAPTMPRQARVSGDAIKQLQNAVKALQTSVNILSASSIEGGSKLFHALITLR